MAEPIIGILGGMGPEATVELYRSIVSTTPAKQDQDHFRILIDNNPKIPDRTAAILGKGSDPFPALLESARILEQAGAGFLIIPCNTAHHWLSELRRSLSIPVLDMIAETAVEVARHRPTLRKIGLLATRGTIQAGLYQQALKAKALNFLTPEPDEQDVIMEVIYRVKAGDYTAKGRLLRVAQHFTQRGAEGLIIGCTELSLIMKQEDADCPVFDPLSVLTHRAVMLVKDGGNDQEP